ncbi:MAG TPA: Ig-like domain repeat protein, partial [Gemmatimonadales bacterium]
VVRFNASAQPGTPPGIRLVAQPPDGARRGVPFSRSPVVQLVDPSGSDLARSGVWVTVGVAAGPGSVRGTLTRTTGADGRAGFDGLSLEGPAGTYTLAFSASGFAGVTSGPIQLARAATTTSILADTPDPSAPGAAVRVVFTVSSEGGRPPGTVTVSADDGGSCTASVSAGACSLALSQTGSRTLTAAYPGTEEFEPSSDTESHTVEAPAEPSLDLETEPPASAALGVPFDPAPVVQLRDGEGRVLRNGGVQVTAGIASGPGALIGETVRTTDDQGRARFEGLGIGGSAGAHVIRFTAPGYTPVASRAVSVGAAATTIRITSDEPDPSDPGEPVQVRYTVTSSAGAPSGSVTVSADGESCTASVADGGCTIALSQPGNRTITASYAGGGPFAPSSATEGHTVNQPPEPPPPSTPSASASSVTVSPATIRVGSGEANIVVTVRDEQGRAMGGVPVTVSASGSGNSITPGGETTRGNGEARFSLRSTVAETKTITAVAGGVTLDDRPTLTVARAASATRIESDEPDPSEPGQPVTVRFTVQGEGGGRPGGVVTVTGVGDSCTAGAPEGSCDIVPTGSGTITARYEGDAEFEPSADDEPHEVRAAPPPAERVLRLETQPSSEARSGQQLERQPQVQLALETGEEVRESQVEVIASLASGGGTLTGPTSVRTDGNGRASFRDLAIEGAGTHTLRFMAAGYRPAISEAIEVAADDDDDDDDDIVAGPL